MEIPIALVVHGGAWDIPDAEVEAHRRGVGQAREAGWAVLHSGGTAIDACVAAVCAMEDDPTFDAAVGSFLNAAGEVELDAGLMDGAALTAGAVAAVSTVRHPIALAKEVLHSEHLLLVGRGAERFAQQRGLECVEPESFVTDRERARWNSLRSRQDFSSRNAFERWGEPTAHPSDTVGAVALDHHGCIAAATSTGGTPNKHPGRVGDSPIIGPGYYADINTGGCSTSGWGEAILKVGLARTACDLIGHGLAPRVAAAGAVMHLSQRVAGLGGCITIDPHGRVGVAFNTPRMAYAWRLADGRQRVAVGDLSADAPLYERGVDRV